MTDNMPSSMFNYCLCVCQGEMNSLILLQSEVNINRRYKILQFDDSGDTIRGTTPSNIIF